MGSSTVSARWLCAGIAAVLGPLLLASCRLPPNQPGPDVLLPPMEAGIADATETSPAADADAPTAQDVASPADVAPVLPDLEPDLPVDMASAEVDHPSIDADAAPEAPVCKKNTESCATDSECCEAPGAICRVATCLRCSLLGNFCGRGPFSAQDCCPGLTCRTQSGGTSSVCYGSACVELHEPCRVVGGPDCCAGMACERIVSGVVGSCCIKATGTAQSPYSTCQQDFDCCPSARCDPGSKVCCLTLGQSCIFNASACCAGTHCGEGASCVAD